MLPPAGPPSYPGWSRQTIRSAPPPWPGSLPSAARSSWDVALLRAGGADIAATPRGYVLPRDSAALLRTVACVHDREGMARELEIMVDQGCQVVDVVVEHPIYGQLAGQLHLSSRYDVQEFIRSVSKNQANLLSDLTGGIHLHTLRCPSEEAFQRVRAALDEAGLLWKG